ncbi:MAG TPA: hypothetical protein PLN21_15695 [Gemmatales bacterium]|nr:hypothetical protein [Gemmatales bacterium]
MSHDVHETHGQWAPPGTPEPEKPRPGIALAVAALLVPILGFVVLIFPNSFNLADTTANGVIVGVTMVVLSSLLVLFDALPLGNLNKKGRKETPSGYMFLGSLVFWIGFFPVSFVRRSRITGPNLSLYALLVTILFAAGPWIYLYLVPPGLPKCDSPDVKELIQDMIRRSPELAATVTRIDGHQEISFDEAAQKRVGQCTLHTDTDKEVFKFIVEWQGDDRTAFYVTPLVELPLCTSLEAKTLLEEIVRKTALGNELKSIDGHRESSYDPQKQERQCMAVLHTSEGEVTINYLLNWQNKAKNMFRIQMKP